MNFAAFKDRTAPPIEPQRRLAALDAAEAAVLLAAAVRRSGVDASGVEAADVVAVVARVIAALEERISTFLDAVVSHPRFVELEGRWRGLLWLAETAAKSGADAPIIRILNTTWSELRDDFRSHDLLEHTALYRLVHERAFDQAGEWPFGVILSDHHIVTAEGFGGSEDDTGVLRALAGVGEKTASVFVCGVDPTALGVVAFGQFDRANIDAALTRKENARLRQFQKDPVSRFIGLVAGRVCVRGRRDRYAYAALGANVVCRAQAGGGDYVWAPASFAFGHVVLKAVVNYNWPGGIRGAVSRRYGYDAVIEPEGGVLTGLQPILYGTERKGGWEMLPVEVILTRAQETAFNAAGMMTLRPCAHTFYAAFYATPSAYSPSAAPGEIVAAGLQNTLCAARFVHWVKIIGRSLLGSTADAADAQNVLTRFLGDYASFSPESDEKGAQRPLKTSSVEVRPVPGAPGSLACNIRLQPHFQTDHVHMEFSLTLGRSQAAAN